MILGASYSQLPLYEAARKLGAATVAASTPGDWPGFAVADESVYADITNPEAILKAAQEKGIDGIATCCLDAGVRALGYTCEKMGLIGPSARAADISNDKFKMKEAFMAGGVQCARHICIHSLEELEEALEKLEFPVVLKAVDLMGSRGIFRCNTREETFFYYNKTMEATRKDYCLVEEFIEGQVLGCEAMIRDGKLLYCLPNNIEAFQSYVPTPIGHSVPYRKQEELGAEVRQQMLKEQPSLLRKLTNGAEIKDFEPASALQYLNQQMQKDFPALDTTDYEIRYVHESMEDFLSPAFYLTPPLDTGRPNVIYINRAGSRSNLELFTTLSHEGFPGHLYQTVFFGKTQPDDIRYLITSGGYVEGWATYVESYGYQYAASLLSDKAAADITTLMWKNRSINLCIYSLLDTGIHYQGWNQAAAAKFLNAFGIQDEKVIAEIYQYIVETPGNYLKYYLGYLNFLDLKTSQQKKLGDSFDLREFHRQVLEIGPVQFPVLAKYMQPAADSSS